MATINAECSMSWVDNWRLRCHGSRKPCRSNAARGTHAHWLPGQNMGPPAKNTHRRVFTVVSPHHRSSHNRTGRVASTQEGDRRSFTIVLWSWCFANRQRLIVAHRSSV